VAECRYISRADSANSLTAQEFGYWSLRWAGESAEKLVRSFSTSPLRDIQAAQVISASPYFAILILSALVGSAHWMFAAGRPHQIGEIKPSEFHDTLKALAVGRNDAIETFRTPQGNPLPADVLHIFEELFNAFFDALHEEFITLTRTSEESLNLQLSAVSRVFLQAVSQTYKAAFNPAEELIVDVFINEIALSTVRAIAQQMSLRT